MSSRLSTPLPALFPPLASASSSSMMREASECRCAICEDQRDVREVGAVGTPLLRSSVLSSMDEMSYVTPEGLDGVVEGKESRRCCSSCRRSEVVNDRAVCRWRWQCLATGAAADARRGALYAAGVRKGRSGCDERIKASPARYKSMAEA